MSIYLGQDKVGVTYFEKANMYEDNRSIMQDTIYTPWTRPEGWPDLDSLNLEMSGTESFIYITFRTGHIDDIFNCEWTLISGQSITFELGQIENGQFVSTFDSYTTSSNSSLSLLFTPDNEWSEGYIVIKITGRFSKFYLKDYTRSAANGGGTIKYYMQPMLERIWYVPELIYFYNGSSTSSSGNGTMLLERDKIANGSGTALTSMYAAWVFCYNLQSLDISELYTPNVANLSCAFEYCKKLEYIDVSHFNTAKVTTISYMFDYCQRLKELDLRTWNTEKLTGNGLTYTFRYCYALKKILGLENFYTNNLTSLVSTFNTCYSLENLSGIINWNTSNITSLNSTFASCHKIKILNLKNWDISKVTNIGAIFSNCQSLEHIQFPTVQTGTLSGSISSLFYYCWNLQEVDLTWIKPITNAVTSVAYLFYYCRSLSEINIPEGWDLTGCIASESFHRVFSGCYKLQKITGISNWDVSNYNYSMNYFFDSCYCLKELDIKNWCPHPTTMYNFFNECRSLEEIDLTGWHWEKMTGSALYCTFNGCYSLKSIKGIEHMGDSGNITSCNATFQSCYSLISIPNISSWDVSKVTTCASMFYDCRSLQSLTITNWTLTKCTAITSMFRYCYNMRELDLSGWSLPALTTNPDYIFCDMWSLVKCSGLPIGLNHRYQSAFSLPEDQWIRIFNQLPTVSGKTLNITTANINRLTTATKAIATNKGWTLAN